MYELITNIFQILFVINGFIWNDCEKYDKYRFLVAQLIFILVLIYINVLNLCEILSSFMLFTLVGVLIKILT
jgi:hypothetical protein